MLHSSSLRILSPKVFRPSLLWKACQLAALAGAVAIGTPASAFAAPAPLALPADDTEALDTLIMQSGQELKGTILAETSTSVRFRLVMGNTTTELEYQKSQIKEIKRAGKKPAEDAKSAPKDSKAAAAPVAATPEETADESDEAKVDPSNTALAAPLDGRPRYYLINLRGEFGEDITQKPIGDALKDARAQKADTVIFYLDANWSNSPFEKLPDDVAAFDEIFRAEDIVPIFDQVNKEWEKAPNFVFWVKTAMGGSALLPLRCPNIYMHSEGRIGGLGNLSQMMEGVGDQVVREKQRSLRLGHAEGWAIKGGYDRRIVAAMARIEYVLSARIEGDKVTLFEGLPSNPSEELLTDAGDETSADTVQARVAGEGNDVLTLKPRIAQLVGVSKGTADTMDELLNQLDLARNGVDVSNRSKRIMEGWSRDLASAKSNILRLLRELGDVRVEEPGGYNERTAARGKRRGIINQIRNNLRRFGEGMSQRWFYQSGLRVGSVDNLLAQLNVMEEQIKIEQLQDRK
jgi:hypothetical protein